MPTPVLGAGVLQNRRVASLLTNLVLEEVAVTRRSSTGVLSFETTVKWYWGGVGLGVGTGQTRNVPSLLGPNDGAASELGKT